MDGLSVAHASSVIAPKERANHVGSVPQGRRGKGVAATAQCPPPPRPPFTFVIRNTVGTIASMAIAKHLMTSR